MHTAYLVVTVVTILANAVIALLDLARVPWVLGNSAAVNVDPSWVPLLGVLKAAGAAGLALGLAGVPYVGLAAAVGLVLFFLGALVAHVRAGVFHNIAVPGAYFALAVASAVLAAAQ
ncbi:DoxX family protein [Nonomuraea candida]|uniref:DoxX family protein n=1 Tax=Nonomuraea candida TaxID=359159 RepID=UPI0005BC8AA5|nr:DoxX family protein [Nonomuraea candida]